MDLSNLDINELKALQKQVADTIVKRKDQLKDDVKQQINQLARKNGMTLDELFGNKTAGNKPKLPPKYCNPVNPNQTWSGRGRAPGWMKEQLDRGAKKEDFLIR